MQEGWNPPRCTFLQPFTYVIFFPPPSPPTESSQCDNRGIISSGSRPCSCKVRTEPAELIQRYIRTIYNFFFSDSVADYAEMPEMAEERLNSCGFNFLLSRTTWRALCATSARPASSTCRRATPRAASSASAWASPGSAAAPLGAETRHVFRGLTHPDTKARLSVCAVMFRRS